MMARVSGARRVIVIGAPARRLEMARKLGADATIDLQTCKTDSERVAAVRDLTDGRGADVVIEAAGHISAFAEGIKLAAKNGSYLVIGLWSAPGTVQVEPRYINNNNIRIIGNALAQPQHLYGAIQVARTHHREYPMADVITDRFTLADTQKALEAVEKLQTIKSVVVPN
jgi:5-exo-hydroxycamphor dehydrogenase